MWRVSGHHFANGGGHRPEVGFGRGLSALSGQHFRRHPVEGHARLRQLLEGLEARKAEIAENTFKLYIKLRS